MPGHLSIRADKATPRDLLGSETLQDGAYPTPRGLVSWRSRASEAIVRAAQAVWVLPEPSEEFARGVCWGAVRPLEALRHLCREFPERRDRMVWAMVTETQAFLPYLLPTPPQAQWLARRLSHVAPADVAIFDRVACELSREAVWVNQTFDGSARGLNDCYTRLVSVVENGVPADATLLGDTLLFFARAVFIRSVAFRDLARIARGSTAVGGRVKEALEDDAVQLWADRAIAVALGDTPV